MPNSLSVQAHLPRPEQSWICEKIDKRMSIVENMNEAHDSHIVYSIIKVNFESFTDLEHTCERVLTNEKKEIRAQLSFSGDIRRRKWNYLFDEYAKAWQQVNSESRDPLHVFRCLKLWFSLMPAFTSRIYPRAIFVNLSITFFSSRCFKWLTNFCTA